MIQMEMGLTMDRDGKMRHMSQPEMLLRIGLTRRVELRLGTRGCWRSRRKAGRGTRGWMCE